MPVAVKLDLDYDSLLIASLLRQNCKGTPLELDKTLGLQSTPWYFLCQNKGHARHRKGGEAVNREEKTQRQHRISIYTYLGVFGSVLGRNLSLRDFRVDRD